ncbi:MAG: sulfite exporter TauE/SafE family protein, partial [Chloroflexi bacterium]|nr:sulfite exporter TauE/SafE family protein [Chloroflexota bacterium]
VSSAGLGLGTLTGFLGIGGGFLIVPALTEIIGLPMHLAVGTSLAIITLNSLAGIASHVIAGNIDWSVATLFILAGYFGTLIGSQLMGGISEKNLKKMFASFILIVATFILTRNLL